MAGYNPQRTRPRPMIDADEPAPVDALLGEGAGGPVHEPVTASRSEDLVEPLDGTAPAPAPEPIIASATMPSVEEVPAAPYVPAAPSAAQRSRSRLMVLGALSAVTLAALVVLRRRRRRR